MASVNPFGRKPSWFPARRKGNLVQGAGVPALPGHMQDDTCNSTVTPLESPGLWRSCLISEGGTAGVYPI